MTATYYASSPGPCANGKSFAENNRECHGLFGASNQGALGKTRTLVCDGRSVTVRIVDRTDGRTSFDLSPKAFRILAGKHWRRVGRVTVRVRRAGR